MALVVRTTITPLGVSSGKFTAQLHGVNDSWITSLQNTPDIWCRIGQDASGMQIIGARAPQISVTGWFGAPDMPSALAFTTNFESLNGETCSILDAWGRNLSMVRLTNTRAFPRRTSGPNISAAIAVKYRVEVSFTAEALKISGTATAPNGPQTVVNISV